MKPSWISINGGNQATGSGDASVTITAAKHTGRSQRTGTVIVEGNGVSEKKTISVTQTAASVFVNFEHAETAVAKTGDNVLITGTSNAQFLNFKLIDKDGKEYTSGTANLNFHQGTTNGGWLATDRNGNYNSEAPATATFPTTFTAASKTNALTTGNTAGQKHQDGKIETTNGESAAYNFSITIPITANTSSAEQRITLQVNAGTNAFAQTTIRLAKGDSFCNLYQDAEHTKALTGFTFAAAGEDKDAYIDSNTSWTVS